MPHERDERMRWSIAAWSLSALERVAREWEPT
jgi:hypothetical protein